MNLQIRACRVLKCWDGSKVKLFLHIHSPKLRRSVVLALQQIEDVVYKAGKAPTGTMESLLQDALEGMGADDTHADDDDD